MTTSLSIQLNDLRGRIGRELGYSRAPSEHTDTQEDDVESVLTDGLRRFYDPWLGDRKHQWSFLQPTIHWVWREGVYRYDLPADFALLDTPINYAVDSNTVWPAVTLTSPEKVMDRLQQSTVTGRPFLAAYRVKPIDDATDTSYELLCFPVPAEDYEAEMRYKINPLNIRETYQVPIGDRTHTQTIIEACLAAAEDFDSRPGIHNQRFLELLKMSISHDQQVNCPRTLGYNADRSDASDVPRDWRTLNNYVVYYDGSAPVDSN